MNKETLEFIKEQIEAIEKHGHGEVVIKIKNGVVYRVLPTPDYLLARNVL